MPMERRSERLDAKRERRAGHHVAFQRHERLHALEGREHAQCEPAVGRRLQLLLQETVSGQIRL